MRLLVCATQGSGGDDEARIKELVRGFDFKLAGFSKRSKLKSFKGLISALRSRTFDLFVLEGSGIFGGFAAILGRWIWGVPYIVSSGDAIAPFLAGRHPIARPIFQLYETLLCRSASGFIGWTPYLVGRALTLGSPRAITIPGWAPYEADLNQMRVSRQRIREQYEIPEDAVVYGLVGSLSWSRRYNYCYGSELVKSARISKREVFVLIVGDGSGLEELKRLAGDSLGRNILLPGRVARHEVPAYLAAMDVGSIPQSVDGVGSFRYTTKLSEYRAAGLPFITSEIPMGFDLDDGCVWRIPGSSPWDDVFIRSLAELMNELTPAEIVRRRALRRNVGCFDRDAQIQSVSSFIRAVYDDEKRTH